MNKGKDSDCQSGIQWVKVHTMWSQKYSFASRAHKTKLWLPLKNMVAGHFVLIYNYCVKSEIPTLSDLEFSQ